ncbi:MAG: phosphoribosylformylglycinamidine cyclo-ligase [Capsulimonadaceae bacterium]
MSEAGKSAYASAGVDIDAATDAVNRMKSHIRGTRTAGVLTGVGSFGGMFALSALGRLDDPVLVSSIDGVGTKINIAFETGRHDTIGRDLVWHCTNDILVQGARPLFFLDYFGTGKLEPAVAEQVVAGLSFGCRSVGCALIGGETAEMPGLYRPGEYDLAGCIVGIVERAEIIDGSRVEPGNAVLGLASEGLHTNGYSLARKVLLSDHGLPLGEPVAEIGAAAGTLANLLLAPHRCYAPSMLPLLPSGKILAMAHITGGGFVDNIPRVLPDGVGVRVDRRAWTVPPLFRLIERLGGVREEEMFRVFNMGIGMAVIVPAGDADGIAAELTTAGETVVRLGETVRGSGVDLD